MIKYECCVAIEQKVLPDRMHSSRRRSLCFAYRSRAKVCVMRTLYLTNSAELIQSMEVTGRKDL